MKPIRTSIMVFVILSFLLTACIPAAVEPAAAVTESTARLARPVALNSPAQKIVSLSPSITEALYAIGAGAQLVGRDEFSDYPAEARSLPSVGGSFGDYNYEVIASLQPDLVLAAEINTPEQVQALENLGLKIYYLSNPTDLESMYASLGILAQLTGRQAETESLVATLRSRVAAVEQKLAGVTEQPLVFYELDASEPAKPWTAGAGTFLDLLITQAGGRNVGSVLASTWAQISQEELLVQNPQIILLGDAAYGVTAESVASRPGWDALAAVQSGQIYPFDDNLVSRPGPRLVDGLEALAAILHPEAFK